MTNAIVEAEVISTAQLIQEGIAKGIDLVALKEILKLREIDDAFKARKAYARDFAIVQSNIEAVVKTRTNSQTHSKYADLGDVIESAKPVYTKEGFSIICYEGDCPKENFMRMYADVLHCAGHRETYHLDLPMDGMGFKGNANMTQIHAKASTSQSARRYLICMILNIPLTDNDGNTQVLPNITDKQLHTLRDLLIAKELPESGLIKVLKVDSLEELPEKRYMEAMGIISAKVKTVKP